MALAFVSLLNVSLMTIHALCWSLVNLMLPVRVYADARILQRRALRCVKLDSCLYKEHGTQKALAKPHQGSSKVNFLHPYASARHNT